MSRSNALVAAVLALASALCAAIAFERVYDVTFRVRPPDGLASHPPQPDGTPLPLRLVDSGGVGVPLDSWGADYSHDRRTFRRAILEGPPYVDAAEFERVARDWRIHVERMLEYGNNAIAVPLLLELIDFDRVRQPDGSPAVYDAASSEFRARHAAVRRHFVPLFEWTARRGMRVFLDTDMLTLTQPVADYLRRVAPDRSRIGIDTANPAVWTLYSAGLQELFDTLPPVAGVVIRFGEGGDLYNTQGWPYWSEMAVRHPASLRAMLQGLLPAFESKGRTLVLRSWTVGVGPLGRLHVDPRVYEEVLGDIDSPALVVSTKFTAGDFFSYLPLNPTLAAGRHKRLVELQARPEFEGFAAFPDFLGGEHARALRAFRAANPHIAGTYVLTQFGGPLRAGPRSLYPLHGFWLWSDANVFVASRLAVDPAADVNVLARQWATRTFGDNPHLADAVVRALTETRKAVLQGFYIRPFAEHQVRVPGLELPPLMWVFEWDMVGGWHSLLSLVYRGSRDEIDAAIAEGHTAVAAVRRAREDMQAAFAMSEPGACTSTCQSVIRSLEYQETLFEVLAAWRQAFLSYYSWLDTGDAAAWISWRKGRELFDRTAREHASRFDTDLDFPAFDVSSARAAVALADRAAWARTIAGLLLFAIVGSIAVRSRIGRLMWTTAVVPWRLARETVGLRIAVTVMAMSLLVVAFIATTLTGFAGPRIGAASAALLASVAFVFEGTAARRSARRGRGRLLVSASASLLPAGVFLLAVIAYAGPVGFWYWFWTSQAFRIALLTVLCATAIWIPCVMLLVRAGEGWRGRIAGALAAAGSGVLVLTMLVPDGMAALRALDRPLNAAPATDTMLFALRAYAGVHVDVRGPAWAAGVTLLAGGVILTLWRRRR